MGENKLNSNHSRIQRTNESENEQQLQKTWIWQSLYRRLDCNWLNCLHVLVLELVFVCNIGMTIVLKQKMQRAPFSRNSTSKSDDQNISLPLLRLLANNTFVEKVFYDFQQFRRLLASLSCNALYIEQIEISLLLNEAQLCHAKTRPEVYFECLTSIIFDCNCFNSHAHVHTLMPHKHRTWNGS